MASRSLHTFFLKEVVKRPPNDMRGGFLAPQPSAGVWQLPTFLGGPQNGKKGSLNTKDLFFLTHKKPHDIPESFFCEIFLGDFLGYDICIYIYIFLYIGRPFRNTYLYMIIIVSLQLPRQMTICGNIQMSLGCLSETGFPGSHGVWWFRQRFEDLRKRCRQDVVFIFVLYIYE